MLLSFSDRDVYKRQVQSSFEEMSEVEKIVENTIEIAPDLTGIFVVSGGQAGVCKAMQKLNKMCIRDRGKSLV